MKPDRVYGVDFSGGMDAGSKIWVAGGIVDGGILQLDLCQRAATFPDSGPKRELALAALRTFISNQAPCVVGLDFPFGLPRVLVEEDRWEDFALHFGDRYPEADLFQVECTNTALARTFRKELRRGTDDEAGTPMSPYNLRIYKQTYYGIRDVLAPLVRSGTASILPMQPATPGLSR